LKVLLISPKIPPAGGMSTWTKTILDESKKAGLADIYIVDTAVRWRNGWNNSSITRVFGGTIQALLNILSTIFKLLKYSPDIIHISSTAGPGSVRDIIIIWFVNLLGLPSVIQYHTGRLLSDMLDNSINWNLALFAMKRSSLIVVFTKQELEIIQKDLPLNNVIIIPNPIDLVKIDMLVKEN